MNLSRHGVRVALALASTAGVSLAWAAGDTARLPKPRPLTTPPAATIEWAETAGTRFQDAIAAIEGLARLPRPRPASAALLAMVAPEEHAPSLPPTLAPPMPAESAADLAACLEGLRTLDVTFEVAAPIGEGGCMIAHPLRVTGVAEGVAIAPETLLNCAATHALATWVRDVVVPASLRTFGEKPSAVRQDSAYVCRNRYDDPAAKVSEHARANAIDIAGVAFSGRKEIEIGKNEAGSREADFEAAIREGACEHFTTVLGPGSNAAHATHFHFDLAKRNGGYRLCELAEPKIVRAPENTTRE